MKKFLYSLIGLAVMLSSASCEQELRNAASDGDEVEATFSVALDGLQTKAYSDGTSATKLQVYVYNTKGYLANVSKLNETINLTTTVSLKLVKGENYEIVFWAQNPDCTAYTINTTDATLTVNPAGLANDETRDAFYKFYTTGLVSGPINETIELKRPFAQINVLDNIDDWKAAEDNGIVFSGSSMKVNAPTKLAFKTGVADTPADYGYTVNAITVDDPNNSNLLTVDGKQAYKYIAMNYILAGDKATSDVTFKVYRDATKDLLYETKVPSVPYQRNYRTNIIGNIFAVDGIFNIIIVPEYEDPDYIVKLGMPVTVATGSALETAISAGSATFDADANAGTVTLVLDATAGATFDFSGIVPDDDNVTATPTYSSSDTTVGTIDKTGKFTAIKAGTTVVTIHYNAIVDGVMTKAETEEVKPSYDATDVVFTVTVTGESEEPTPVETVATPTFNPAAGEVEAGTKVAITTTTEGATIYYSLTDAAPATEYKEAIEITEAVTIKAIAKKEGMTDSEIATAAYTVKAVTPEYTFVGDGTVNNPYTATDMIHYIDALTSVPSEEEVYIKGKVTSILNNGQFSAKYGNASFWISEDGTSQVFEVFRVLYLENRKWETGDAEIAVGDDVVVYAKVTLYNPASGDPVYETYANTDPVYNGYLYSLNGKTKIEAAPVFDVAINNTSEVAAAGGTKTITITSNVDWTVEGTTGLTFSATSGNGNATVTVTVPANTDTENGKEWTVNVKTTATGLTANAYPFNFTQAKYVEPTGDETVVSVDQDYLAANKEGVIGDISYTNSSDYGTNVVTELRVYKSQTLTFTIPAGKTLTKVVLTCTANGTTKQGPGCFGAGAPAGYTFEAEGPTGTWTGSATESLSFTATDNQVRITAIEVTYK